MLSALPRLPCEPVTDTPAPAASPRTIRYYWEDFAIGAVREFGRCEVTREAMLEFAARYDPQPFHLDDAAAASSLFGRLAASGWHTCAMAMRMMCDGYLLESASLGSPGVERLVWPAPVFPGDVLTMRNTVLDARPLASRPQVGLVRSRSEVLNQAGQVVLAMEGVGFFRRRDTGAPPAVLA
jgi:acyl dehydratase